MKNLKSLFIILMVGLLFYFCEKDEIEFVNSEDKKNQLNQRSYNQEDCGFIDSFCEKVDIRTTAYAELIPWNPDVPFDEEPCLVGEDPSSSTQFKIQPIQLCDGSIAIYYADQREEYLVLSDENRILQKDIFDMEVPVII